MFLEEPGQAPRGRSLLLAEPVRGLHARDLVAADQARLLYALGGQGRHGGWHNDRWLLHPVLAVGAAHHLPAGACVAEAELPAGREAARGSVRDEQVCGARAPDALPGLEDEHQVSPELLPGEEDQDETEPLVGGQLHGDVHDARLFVSQAVKHVDRGQGLRKDEGGHDGR